MRTPKIQSLHRLIDWMNNPKNQASNIPKLPINLEPLGSNPWLSGFIDADGHFSVRASVSSKLKYPVVECRLESSQRQVDHNGFSNYAFMVTIAAFLGTLSKEFRIDTKFPQYRIRTTNLASNVLLENYLNKYPLFSSQHLYFIDWLKVLEFFKNSDSIHKSIDEIIKIKDGMNNQRTIFN